MQRTVIDGHVFEVVKMYGHYFVFLDEQIVATAESIREAEDEIEYEAMYLKGYDVR